MEYWVIAGTALIIAALLAFIVGTGRARGPQKPGNSFPEARPREPCPLCGAPLLPGERVKSEVFPGQKERITHIRGCPHCLPPNDDFPRTCPVCRLRLPPEGFVVGRMWERRAARTGAGQGRARQHLHIAGCTLCHPAKGRELHPCP